MHHRQKHIKNHAGLFPKHATRVYIYIERRTREGHWLKWLLQFTLTLWSLKIMPVAASRREGGSCMLVNPPPVEHISEKFLPHERLFPDDMYVHRQGCGRHVGVNMDRKHA
jgi:hypothetical protein